MLYITSFPKYYNNAIVSEEDKGTYLAADIIFFV